LDFKAGLHFYAGPFFMGKSRHTLSLNMPHNQLSVSYETIANRFDYILNASLDCLSLFTHNFLLYNQIKSYRFVIVFTHRCCPNQERLFGFHVLNHSV
jgi:hypothetical protein